MKKIYSLLFVILFLSVSSVYAEDTPSPQTLNLQIKGMSCEMCAHKVESSIKKLNVIECHVDVQKGQGVVKYDPSKVKIEQIMENCNMTGYKCEKI